METIIKKISVAAVWSGSGLSCKGASMTGNAFLYYSLKPLHNEKFSCNS